MTLAISITHQDVYKLLGDFLTGVLPTGVPVIQGLNNRTSLPPPSPGYVAMTVTMLTDLHTPIETWDTTNPNPTVWSIQAGTKMRMQLDCYGAASGDWAEILATMLRTEYACQQLAPVAPLFADSPVQAPLVNSESQYESRWIVGANLQYNPVITTPLQTANTLAATLLNVDERYPPS